MNGTYLQWFQLKSVWLAFYRVKYSNIGNLENLYWKNLEYFSEIWNILENIGSLFWQKSFNLFDHCMRSHLVFFLSERWNSKEIWTEFFCDFLMEDKFRSYLKCKNWISGLKKVEWDEIGLIIGNEKYKWIEKLW